MSNRDLINQLLELEDIDLDVISKAAYALEAHEWQPIDENTPKDGTPIILEGLMQEPNMGGERRITQEVHQGYWSAGMWQTGTFYHWVEVFRWMPMPQPGDKDE